MSETVIPVEEQEPVMNYVERFLYELAKELTDCDVILLRYYTLLGLVKGENTTLEDVHDAGSVRTYGIVPNHESMLPFGELTPEVQELGRKYADAIKSVARKLSS